MNYLVKTSSLSRYLNEINAFPLLSRDEEFKLALKYKNEGDLAAAHKLVTSNLRFVVKIANQYKSYGIKVKDLIQEGNLGLMNAVKRFDPQKGYRLISYAVWWIKAFIQKFILETYSLVKIGTTQAQRKLFASMGKIRRKLTTMGGKEPTDADLAQALDVKTRDVVEMKQRLVARDNSLDSNLNEDSQTTHLEILESETPNQEEIISKKEEQNKIIALITPLVATFKEKEKLIFEKRLLTDDPQTLQEIGAKYKISRERVRQIEDNLKKKIKGYLMDKGFEYSPAS